MVFFYIFSCLQLYFAQFSSKMSCICIDVFYLGDAEYSCTARDGCGVLHIIYGAIGKDLSLGWNTDSQYSGIHSTRRDGTNLKAKSRKRGIDVVARDGQRVCSARYVKSARRGQTSCAIQHLNTECGGNTIRTVAGAAACSKVAQSPVPGPGLKPENTAAAIPPPRIRKCFLMPSDFEVSERQEAACAGISAPPPAAPTAAIRPVESVPSDSCHWEAT